MQPCFKLNLFFVYAKNSMVFLGETVLAIVTIVWTKNISIIKLLYIEHSISYNCITYELTNILLITNIVNDIYLKKILLNLSFKSSRRFCWLKLFRTILKIVKSILKFSIVFSNSSLYIRWKKLVLWELKIFLRKSNNIY